jgi:hypothetical protein
MTDNKPGCELVVELTAQGIYKITARDKVLPNSEWRPL